MDIKRIGIARRRLIKLSFYLGLLAIALACGSWFVWHLKPAPPSVERATLWIDTVKFGPMVRAVRGTGTLVPEDIRWITATSQGRVEQKHVLPGAIVSPGTVLIELNNPQLEQETFNAQWEWKEAQTNYNDLRVKLESQRLSQESQTATVESEYQEASIQAEADTVLNKDGLIPDLQLKRERAKAEQLAARLQIEKARLKINLESIQAQLESQQAKIEKARSFYELKKDQLEQLKVRAGVAGVLQLLPVQLGQQVTIGTNLARVADPTKLKAVLKVAETQAKDITIGQSASIDTRNGIIPGTVIRIDPSVQENTVSVDVALTGALPKGARPDLTVDGTIILENLTGIVYVGRPVQAEAEARISLFKLDPDQKHAVRVAVRLGRSSVNSIEIREGLKQGDRVILSDVSTLDGFDRVRLN